MSETEFSVMRYPGPDGVRPIDLARRCNMTKQAMNYVLMSFEAKGYIERKSPKGQRSTTIYLTRKGWKLLSATRHCATEIEDRWAAHIGARRFSALRASLHEIAVWLGKLPATPPAVGPHGKAKVGPDDRTVKWPLTPPSPRVVPSRKRARISQGEEVKRRAQS
jgi:DNA-binding MarR family transcriptional regulator